MNLTVSVKGEGSLHLKSREVRERDMALLYALRKFVEE